MAATDADICNLSLSLIGEKGFIDSLTDNTLAARTCNRIYSTARDFLLEMRSWPFATRHALLSLIEDHTVTPPTMRKAWTYIYGLPSDCLPNGALYLDIGIRNPPPEVTPPFEVEDDATSGPILMTDEKSAELAYLRRVTEVGKMPASFQKALAGLIAFELTFAIPNKNGLREGMGKYAEEMLDEAASSAFRHQKAQQPPQPSGIRMRRGSLQFPQRFSRR